MPTKKSFGLFSTSDNISFEDILKGRGEANIGECLVRSQVKTSAAKRDVGLLEARNMILLDSTNVRVPGK